MKGLITIIMALIMAFYILGSTFSPMETSATQLTSVLGGAIANESLGNAGQNTSTNLATDYSPLTATSPTAVYNGTTTVSVCGTAPCYAVDRSNGIITINNTGEGTTGQIEAYTVDYSRLPSDSNITALNTLPYVALLLFVLAVILGIVYVITGRAGVM